MSGREPTDWEDPKASIRWVARELGSRHRPLALRVLRGMPSGVTKRFWGGGARLANMGARQFAAGLVDGLADSKIERSVALAWYRLNGDVADLVAGCASAWPQIDGEIDPEAWEFLCNRGQLSADVLAATTVARDYPACRPSLPTITATHGRSIFTTKEADDTERLLVLTQSRPDLLAVETLGVRVHRAFHKPFFDQALAEGDYDAVVNDLLGTGDGQQVAAAYYRLLQGDANASEHLSHRFIEDRVGGPDGAMMTLLALLAQGKAAHGLELLEDCEDDLAGRGVMLRAVLESSIGSFERAALTLCALPYGKCSLRSYPLALCDALLRRADILVPEELAEVAEQGWCSSRLRKRAIAGVRACAMGRARATIATESKPPSRAVDGEKSANATGRHAERDLHPNLRPTSNLAGRFWSTKELLQQLTSAQKWGEVARTAEELQAIQSAFEACSADLRSRLDPGSSCTGLQVDSTQILQSQEAFDDWLAVAEDAIEESANQETRLLEAAREKLRHDLAAAALEEPEDLREAHTLEQVQELREEFASELAIRRGLARARSEGVEAACLDRLLPDERLEVLRLLANGGVDAQFVDRLIRDTEITDTCREEAAQLVMGWVEKLLRASKALPEGALSYLVANLRGTPGVLVTSGLLDAVALAPSVESRELVEAFGDLEIALPTALRERLKLYRALQKPVDARLPVLASMLAEQPQAESIQEAVFGTLLELGRYGESVYLAGLLTRSGSAAAPEEAMRQAVSRLLLSPSVVARKSESAIAFLSDWDWWLERDESVVTLLYLFRAYDLDDDLINFRFAAPDAIDAALRHFPALVAHLLGDHEERNSGALQPARSALSEFRKELSRESCYTSWTNAAAYQVCFRRVLEEHLEALSEGRQIQLPRDVAEIIDRCTSHQLPAAEGTARRAMMRYLQDQVARLHVIKRVLPTTSLEELASPTEEWREAVLEEGAQASGGSILALVYAGCVGMSE